MFPAARSISKRCPAAPSTHPRSTPKPPRSPPTTKPMARRLSPELDARFAQLADERIAAHPLRYYLLLPLGRVADMWLRPRVENLPIDLDWWVYTHHHVETRFSWFYAGLNALYLAAWRRRTVPAPAPLACDAGLHVAAQRLAADGRGARSALHAGVLSHAVCIGRNRHWTAAAESRQFPKLLSS